MTIINLTDISYMIYLNNSKEYKVIFFEDPYTKKVPVRKYLESLNERDRQKIFKYIDYLQENKGVLDEPYTKHIRDKIRELRIDFSKNRHRIFFFTFVGKNIILLHAFLKKTAQTPESEIQKALNNYYKVTNNPKLYV